MNNNEDEDVAVAPAAAAEEEKRPITIELKIPKTLKECIDYEMNHHLSGGDNSYINQLIISETDKGDASTIGWTDRSNIILDKCWPKHEELKNTTILALNNLWLDNWEPLLRSLKPYDNLEILLLRQCFLTERGADILANFFHEFANQNSPQHLLNARNIQETGWKSLHTIVFIDLKGYNSWLNVNDFCPVENKTLIRISSHNINNEQQDYDDDDEIIKIHNLDTIHQAEYSKWNPKMRGGFENVIVRMCTLPRFSGKGQQVQLLFNENQQFSFNLCRGIGRILRQACTLVKLKVENLKKANLPHDFLKDAKQCIKLVLDQSNFDPHTVASILRQEYKKDILLDEDESSSSSMGKALKFKNLVRQDMIKIQTLLNLVDISCLRSLEMDGYLHESFKNYLDAPSRAFRPLYRYLAENKGPRKLSLSFHHDDLNEFASHLAMGLRGNDKITQLVIHTKSCTTTTSNNDHDGLKQLFHAIGKMPNLQAVSLQWDEKETTNMNMKQQQWNKWILNMLCSNWNIIYLRIDRSIQLDKAIDLVLMQNKKLKKWTKLLRLGESKSDVWSLALGRIIQKENDADLLFRILKEVPSLFQQAIVVKEPTTTKEEQRSCNNDDDCQERESKRPKLN